MARTPIELQSLRPHFVILATLIALSTGWAVYDEVFARRPWKDYQREFFSLEEKRYQRDKEDALAAIDKNALAAAQKELAEATSAIADPDNSQKFRDAQEKLRNLKLDEYDAKQAVGFAKARADEKYYFYREAKHHGTPDELAARTAELDALQKTVEEKQKLYDAQKAERALAEKEVQAFEDRRATASGELEKLQAPVADAERKLASVHGKWPMIEQYWLPELNAVDRCQNCHAGIAKAGYAPPWEVAAARSGGMNDEDVKKRFGISPAQADEMVTAHDALCPAADAAAPSASAATECLDSHAARALETKSKNFCGSPDALWKKWVRKEEKLCTDKETRAAVEEAAKGAFWDVPLVFQSHPHRWELLVVNHPPEKFGCTQCHGGQGAQTKGVEHRGFAHAHEDHYWGNWNEPLLDRVKVLGVEKKGLFVQSMCQKCHTQDVSLAHAPKLNQGKRLVVELGCVGCHPIAGYEQERKKGPQLKTIAAKVDPGWIVKWLEYPKAWRPRTTMPNFWPDAAGEDAKPEKIAQRDRETKAIAAFLTSISQTSLPIANPPPPGDAARGKELAESVGCRGCHTFQAGDTSRPNRASRDRDYAPNLSNVGDKINYPWAYNWVKNPRGVWPGTRMPSLRLSDDEARDLAAYLVSLKTDAKFATPEELAPDHPRHAELVAHGKKLVEKYGCFGCHDIAGFEKAQKIGAELSEFGKKTADLLDFGDYITNPKMQNWYNWLHEKLRRPRIYAYERVDAKMPQFDVSEQEIEGIMTFLKSQNGARVPVKYLAGQSEGRAAWHQGEKLIEQYGCRNCHVVKNDGGLVRDQYEETVAMAPPILPTGEAGQGLKVQPSWLFAFLKDPSSTSIRPWLKIRMPTFQFTDAEASALVKGFSGDAGAPFPFLTVDAPPLVGAEEQEAKALFTTLQCLNCHVVGKPPPGRDLAELAPDFGLARHRLRPEWIEPWLKNPNAIQEGTRMPGFFPPEMFPASPYPQFGGDAKKQMDALKRYIYNLPGAKPVKSASASRFTKTAALR